MYILAIDQGTTGTTVVAYDAFGQPAARAYSEFTQHYPRPGWVEHDPLEIWRTVQQTIGETCSQLDGPVVGLGITNQRETTVVWNKRTGKPIHNAIVWQCRRTADMCRNLQEHVPALKEKTGLPLDAYFSGTKIKWILNQYPELAVDELAFGTIDSWLIWQLTNGASHVTDYSNASRTLLFNINSKTWDSEAAEWLGVPLSMLPRALPSRAHFGIATTIDAIKDAPILAVLGDQQSALFGQTCYQPGSMKNTYGTGAFMVMNTGTVRVDSPQLVTTIAADATGQPCFALEGSIFIAGAAIQWLRDELQLIDKASDSESMATAVDDNAGVYLVPAFVGLGAPHWDMNARGIITGLTRGAGRNHIVRAALEAMAYQTYDVFESMHVATKLNCESLAVDGGATSNSFLMQFQADILQLEVHRPSNIESTSMGVAMLAGVGIGWWKDAAALSALRKIEHVFSPTMALQTRNSLVAEWHDAVNKAQGL